MTKRGYIAGSLFNEAEGKQRLYEGQTLREKTGDKIKWYNPIEAPINDKEKLPTALDIFSGDTKEVIQSDFIFADLTNNDVGVFMELGVAYGLQYARKMLENIFKEQDEAVFGAVKEALDSVGIKNKTIIGVCSDIRLETANQYSGINVPYGINQYCIGGLLSMNSIVYKNFDSAVSALAEVLKEGPKDE